MGKRIAALVALLLLGAMVSVPRAGADPVKGLPAASGGEPFAHASINLNSLRARIVEVHTRIVRVACIGDSNMASRNNSLSGYGFVDLFNDAVLQQTQCAGVYLCNARSWGSTRYAPGMFPLTHQLASASIWPSVNGAGKHASAYQPSDSNEANSADLILGELVDHSPWSASSTNGVYQVYASESYGPNRAVYTLQPSFLASNPPSTSERWFAWMWDRLPAQLPFGSIPSFERITIYYQRRPAVAGFESQLPYDVQYYDGVGDPQQSGSYAPVTAFLPTGSSGALRSFEIQVAPSDTCYGIRITRQQATNTAHPCAFALRAWSGVFRGVTHGLLVQTGMSDGGRRIAGVNGWMHDGSAHDPQRVYWESDPPDIILMSFGHNDAALGVPPEQFRASLVQFAERVGTYLPDTLITLCVPWGGNVSVLNRATIAAYLSELNASSLPDNIVVLDFLTPSQTALSANPVAASGYYDFGPHLSGSIHGIYFYQYIMCRYVLGNESHCSPPVEYECGEDADGSGAVDVNDIVFIVLRLGATGPIGEVAGDADMNGVVDQNDISYTLLRMGTTCPVYGQLP